MIKKQPSQHTEVSPAISLQIFSADFCPSADFYFFITICKRTFTSLVIISSHQLYFSIDLENSVPGVGAVSHGILLQETLQVQKAGWFVDTLMSASMGMSSKEWQ